MLITPTIWPESPMKLPTGADKNIRDMWEFMLKRVVMQGGPFAGTPKSDKLEKLAKYIIAHYIGLKTTRSLRGGVKPQLN